MDLRDDEFQAMVETLQRREHGLESGARRLIGGEQRPANAAVFLGSDVSDFAGECFCGTIALEASLGVTIFLSCFAFLRRK